jgi:hypothetical protein
MKGFLIRTGVFLVFAPVLISLWIAFSLYFLFYAIFSMIRLVWSGK